MFTLNTLYGHCTLSRVLGEYDFSKTVTDQDDGRDLDFVYTYNII